MEICACMGGVRKIDSEMERVWDCSCCRVKTQYYEIIIIFFSINIMKFVICGDNGE